MYRPVWSGKDSKEQSMKAADEQPSTKRTKKKRKVRAKKSKLQKEILKEAKASGKDLSEVNDGIFFIDTVGSKDSLPEESKKDELVGTAVQTGQDGHNGIEIQWQEDDVESTRSQAKTVPDYVGNEKEVKDPIRVDAVPVQGSSKDLEQPGLHITASDAIDLIRSDDEDSDDETGSGAEEGETDDTDEQDDIKESQIFVTDTKGSSLSEASIDEAQTPSEDANGDQSLAHFVADLEDEAQEDSERREALRYFREDDPLQTCHRCGETGHSVRNCEHVQCLTCGKLDEHTTRACPLTMTCHRCSSRGHHIKDCPVDPNVARRRLNQICERCSSTLHTSSNCPYIWRVYIRSPNAPVNPPKMRFACYNCASGDHFGDDCKFPRVHPLKYVDRSAFTLDDESSKRRRLNPNVELSEGRTTLPRPDIVNGKKSDKKKSKGNKGGSDRKTRPNLQQQIEMESEDEEEVAFESRLQNGKGGRKGDTSKSKKRRFDSDTRNDKGKKPQIQFKNMGDAGSGSHKRFDSPQSYGSRSRSQSPPRRQQYPEYDRRRRDQDREDRLRDIDRQRAAERERREEDREREMLRRERQRDHDRQSASRNARQKSEYDRNDRPPAHLQDRIGNKRHQESPRMPMRFRDEATSTSGHSSNGPSLLSRIDRARQDRDHDRLDNDTQNSKRSAPPPKAGGKAGGRYNGSYF